MKRFTVLSICLALCLSLLSGCSCDHDWIDATCTEPKTCAKCDETKGKPLGHKPGKLEETVDEESSTVIRKEYCTVCNELLDTVTTQFNPSTKDDCFAFTPNEFMETLATLSAPYVEDFSYEFTYANGLMARVNTGKKQAVLQFFRSDTTALAEDEKDTAEVWCVSLIQLDVADADLRHCIMMVCDPSLDKTTAFDLDMAISAAYLNAMTGGQSLGYYLHNDLLYESSYIPEDSQTQTPAMNMTNIYASDYR